MYLCTWQYRKKGVEKEETLTGFLQCGWDGDCRANAHHIWRDPNHGAGPQDPHHRQPPGLHRRPPSNQHSSCAVAHLARVTWEGSELVSCAEIS